MRIGADDRGRTGTGIAPHGILSPVCVCKKNRVSYIARLSAFLAYVCVYVSRGERERRKRVIQGGGVGKSGGLIHVTPWVTAAVTDKARRRRAAPAGAVASARTDCRQQTARNCKKSDCAAAHSLPMSDLALTRVRLPHGAHGHRQPKPPEQPTQPSRAAAEDKPTH